MWIFDSHQDIALSTLFTTNTDFFKSNKISDGWNNLGLPVNNQTDFPRLLQSDTRATFAAVCTFSMKNGQIYPSKKPNIDTLEQINEYKKIIRDSKNKVFLIKNKKGLKLIKKGKLGLILHLEGADVLSQNPKHLEALFNSGVRSIGLTWNFANNLAGGAKSKQELTNLGRQIIKEMEEKGILLDLSHLNLRSTIEVLKIIKKPCIISHTNCLSLCNNLRNTSDEIMRKVSKRGGLIGISAVPSFIGKNPTIEKLCNHIIYAIKLCGVENVCLGTDFGAMTDNQLTYNFSDVSDIPRLYPNLLKMGLSEKHTQMFMHSNVVNLLKNILPN
ncbi:hypothetical protein A2955_05365 [Candidatus Woesebacteria bacterium RIFCSPLOWO2_01_FULL_37_19]|uniref:Peptidase n=2 Tax=Candidatus Woeseibacteriota TaxID=1752722 RepID=A0A1F8B5E0_9BACT|nr:MAG: hypothetical protein A2771_04510 [Candidatus Woesebacteria bacterium RIFCSPHIGHO2_01_FULL_38_26b]OGM59253.1 MAG: hypothetical protein A2955_05365 [Candidatus Woesebacteria bacterium RIFCSPLOWO2_01_FULL_37_19]